MFARLTSTARRLAPRIAATAGATAVATGITAYTYLPSASELLREIVSEEVKRATPSTRSLDTYFIRNHCIPAIKKGIADVIDKIPLEYDFLKNEIKREMILLFTDIDNAMHTPGVASYTGSSLKTYTALGSHKLYRPGYVDFLSKGVAKEVSLYAPFISRYAAAKAVPAVTIMNVGKHVRSGLNKSINGLSGVSKIVASRYCNPYIKKIIKNIAINIKIKFPSLAPQMDGFIEGVNAPAPSRLAGGRRTRKRCGS